MHEFLAEKDLRSGLVRLGISYLSRHQARAASIRTVANQPIAQEFYENVLRPAWQRLADRFAVMMKEGRLKFADPWTTAMHWKGLNEWDMLEKHLLSAKHASDRNDIVTAATAAADAFLKVYAPPPETGRGRAVNTPAWSSASAIADETFSLPFEVQPNAEQPSRLDEHHVRPAAHIDGGGAHGRDAYRLRLHARAIVSGSQEPGTAAVLLLGPHVPRDVGLLLIAGGNGSLALFTWQYLRAVTYLGDGTLRGHRRAAQGVPLHQLTCFTAYAIMLIGVVAFASVLVSF